MLMISDKLGSRVWEGIRDRLGMSEADDRISEMMFPVDDGTGTSLETETADDGTTLDVGWTAELVGARISEIKDESGLLATAEELGWGFDTDGWLVGTGSEVGWAAEVVGTGSEVG